jgi:23S rRNA pseudouridine1911/1915/1917 synthase
MPNLASQTVFVAEATERLDVFLARSLPQFSRSYLQKLCKEGHVRVDGQVVTKTSTQLEVGQQVAIELPSSTAKTGTLPVIYEDDDVVVLNKPAGLLTHTKGALSDEFTVADFVRPRTTDGLDTNRPGIVHRLDRATSGVIIAARTPEAKRWLQKQFATRKVKKTYLALVTGQPRESSARIVLPIERNPKKPQTFRVGGNGKPAETTYETLTNYAAFTLLKLRPTTGRTHQLRVHLTDIGHPIVGDELYGQPAPKLGRMFLHAAELELTLPSRQRKVFTAPLPPELQNYLNSLQ